MYIENWIKSPYLVNNKKNDWNEHNKKLNISKNDETRRKLMKNELKQERAITLIALVVTIVLNFSYLEMARMNKFEKI